ncbi:MAG: tetratricopeptide repeat protein [Candidatus Tectomicrobia bacterium]|nr:tetratricopeptide repeat protein [Candidatus Tectomicrobia bacterium]
MTVRRLAPLALFLLALLVYLPSLRNGFVYDDWAVVVQNEHLRTAWRWRNLVSRGYFEAAGELSYRPLVTLSYRLDSLLWGLRPAGFHLTNTLLHALVALTFFSLLLACRLPTSAAVAAAVLFAVHPAATEAVNAIGFREDLLAALFVLLACRLALSWLSTTGRYRTWAYLALALLAYVLALLAKESALALPLLVGLLIIAPGAGAADSPAPRPPSRSAGLLASVALVTAAYLVLRFALLVNPAEAARGLTHLGWLQRLFVTSRIFAYELKLLWLPAPLSVDYVVAARAGLAPGIGAWPFGVAAVLGLAAYLLAAWRLRGSAVGLGLGWLLVSWLPASNVYPLAHPLAERYLYLPLLGGCMLGGLGWAALWHRRALPPGTGPQRGRSAAAAPLALALLVPLSFALLSVQRTYAWRRAETLWTPVVARFPRSFLGYQNLGAALQGRGAWDKALLSYAQSLAAKPSYAAARHNLATVLLQRHAWQAARREYRRLVAEHPAQARSLANLGIAHYGLGEYEPAEATLRRALALLPDYAEARNNLGLVLAARGRPDKAHAAYAAAVLRKPGLQGARENLRRSLGGYRTR